MNEEPDYIVEIGTSGTKISDSDVFGSDVFGSEEKDNSLGKEGIAKGRKYICVQFDCCNVYNRIYKNRAGTAYEGYCPRCGKRVKVRIGPNGVDARFFRAR